MINYLLHKCNKYDERETPSPTFTTISGDLGEGVVAAVALAPDHAGLALALAAVAVTRSGEGAERVTVAQQTAVAALGMVVVVLDTSGEEGLVDGRLTSQSSGTDSLIFSSFCTLNTHYF